MNISKFTIHIAIKMGKDKEKARSENQLVIQNWYLIRLLLNSSVETLYTRRECDNIFKVMKGRKKKKTTLFCKAIIQIWRTGEKLYRKAKANKVQHSYTNFWLRSKVLPKQKQHIVVGVTGNGSKVWRSKEQFCIRTWNIWYMNQSKLEVVKPEMARVNVDI